MTLQSTLIIYAAAAPPSSPSAQGTTIGAPTWNRPQTVEEGNVQPATALSTASATHYAAFDVSVPTDGIFEFDVNSSSGAYGFSPVVCLYNGHFDATYPLANNEGCDGGDAANQVGPSLSARLSPSISYFAVVTGLTNADEGDFTLSMLGQSNPTINFRSILTGTTTSSSDTTARPQEGSAPLTVSSSTDQFAITGFGVSVAGSYTFDVGGSFDAFACLYSPSFNKASSVTGGITCADVGGTTPHGALLTAQLLTGTRYVLMVTGAASGEYGTWSANVDGPSSIVGPAMTGNLAGKSTWIHPVGSSPPVQGSLRAPYEARPFELTQSGGYSIYLGEGDQFLCIYNAPFDPSFDNSTKNVIACNDDSGDNNRSSAVMISNLTANTPYVLVASSYNQATGAGPWEAEFYGPGSAITVPDAPSVTSATDDGRGNVVLAFRGADTNTRPTTYTATLSPYLGTPGTAVTGTSPLTVPIPAGSDPGDPLSLFFTANTAAGSSPTTEIDPPRAESIGTITSTPPFAATLTYTAAANEFPSDVISATAVPDDSSDNSDSLDSISGGSATLPALSPGAHYTVSVTHSNVLGSASTSTTFTTPTATDAGTSRVSAASSPTFVRPEAGASPPLTSSGQVVPFQSTYFHVSVAGAYSFLASSASSWDSILTLASAPFDPSNPTSSALLAVDDTDGSDASLATQAFTTQLTPGDYDLVLAGYSPDQSGTSDLEVSGPGGAVPIFYTPGTPGAPNLTSISDAGSGAASLAITAPTDPQGTVTGYRATFHPAAGGADVVAALSAAATQTVAGLSDGTSYSVTLQAINAAGAGEPATAVRYTEPTVPSTIARPTVDMIGATTARVSFVPPNGNGLPITSYQAVVQPGNLVFSGDAAGDPISLSGLAKGVNYTVTVLATNGRGDSAPSPTTSFTSATVPAAPQVSDISPGVHSASFTFSAPDDRGSPVVRYAVVLTPTTGSSPAVTLDPAPTAAGRVTVSGLVTNTTYSIAVTATNVYGTGPANASATVTPLSTVATAPTVTSLDGVTASAGVVHFTPPSDPGSDSVMGYVATVQPGGATFSAGAGATSINLTGLDANSGYSVSVAAVTQAGAGKASSGFSFTTSGPPAAPTISGVTPAINSIAVDYSTPANHGAPVSRYSIQAVPVEAGGVTRSVTSTSGSATVTGLVSLTQYVIRVEALNTYGTGPAASITASTLDAVPARPALGGVVPGHGQLRVLLSHAPARGVQAHVVVRPRAGGKSVEVISQAASVLVSKLRDGRAYVVQVYLVSSGGQSAAVRVDAIVGTPHLTLKATKIARGQSTVTSVLTVGGTPDAGQKVEIETTQGRSIGTAITNRNGSISLRKAVRAGTALRATTTFGSSVVRSPAVRVN